MGRVVVGRATGRSIRSDGNGLSDIGEEGFLPVLLVESFLEFGCDDLGSTLSSLGRVRSTPGHSLDSRDDIDSLRGREIDVAGRGRRGGRRRTDSESTDRFGRDEELETGVLGVGFVPNLFRKQFLKQVLIATR